MGVSPSHKDVRLWVQEDPTVGLRDVGHTQGDLPALPFTGSQVWSEG